MARVDGSRLRRAAKAVERLFRQRLRNPLMARLNGWRFRALPTVMITGTCGKTTTSRLTASILAAAGHRVGLATTDGVLIDGEIVATGDLAGVDGHRLALSDRRVTAAVLETARGSLALKGLYVHRVNAAALINVGSDHLGFDGVETVDEMARLKARVTDAARGAVVLSADDPRCLALVDRYGTAKVILFAGRADHPALIAHMAAGGRAIAAVGGMMRFYRGQHAPVDLVALDAVPVTRGGRAAPYVADAMAAAGLALALGIPGEVVAAGLKGFAGGLAQNPGRFTAYPGLPFTLVADHAKNALGLRATLPLLDHFGATGRRIVAMTAAGNRADAQYAEVAAAIAGHFDRYIVYETEYYRRGRAADEITAHLAGGLNAAGVPADAIEVISGTAEAFSAAAAMARPGDLVLLLAKFPRDRATIASAFGLAEDA